MQFAVTVAVKAGLLPTDFCTVLPSEFHSPVVTIEKFHALLTWLAEQEHQLACWRRRVQCEDCARPNARRKADTKVSGYLEARLGAGYLVVNVLGGEVLWSPSDSSLPFVVLYTHDDGPIRPDGA